MATPFWHLANLSNAQLLARLQSVLHTKRRALAELIAHLGEVEERRLHLQAACSSLFSYCVQRLGMSEDEACRRIEVARLARKFPALFAELASGGLTLSVALLLKRVLAPENHLELFAALRGASTERARELLAARFPSPDVPSGVRKLPERHNPASRPANATLPAQAPVSVAAPLKPPFLSSEPSQATPPTAASPASELPANELASEQAFPHELPANGMAQPDPPPSATARQPEPSGSRLQQRIEPLSAGRYRVQFTADASLKRKIEQARALLRHAQPDGDLGAIVARALDLLLDELMQHRFGTLKRRVATRAAGASAAAPPAPVAARTTSPAATPAPMAAAASTPTPIAERAAPETDGTATPKATAAAPPTSAAAPPTSAAAPPSTTAKPPALHGVGRGAPSRVARAARRAVLERDGLGCSWVDAEGRRCGSTAWLELDHRHPAGKGGSSEPQNLRMLCRAHNRFAAERAYGRAHIERAVRARLRSAPPRRPY